MVIKTRKYKTVLRRKRARQGIPFTTRFVECPLQVNKEELTQSDLEWTMIASKSKISNAWNAAEVAVIGQVSWKEQKLRTKSYFVKCTGEKSICCWQVTVGHHQSLEKWTILIYMYIYCIYIYVCMCILCVCNWATNIFQGVKLTRKLAYKGISTSAKPSENRWMHIEPLFKKFACSHHRLTLLEVHEQEVGF